MTIGETSFTESFQILVDPRVDAGAEDLAAQFDFGLQIRDAISRMNEVIIALRDVREQLAGWEKRLSRLKDAGEALTEVKRLSVRLTEIEEEFINTKSSSRFGYPPPNVPTRLQQKLAMLAAMNGSADAAPTKQAREVLAVLLEQVDAQLNAFEGLLNTDIPALNESIRTLNLPAIQPTPPTGGEQSATG